MTESPHIPPRPDGALARAVRRAAGVAAARPRTAIALWLVLVAGCVLAGGAAGTRTLTETESGVGESARADERIEAAGLRDPAVENVLVPGERRRPPPRARGAGVPAQRLDATSVASCSRWEHEATLVRVKACCRRRNRGARAP
jgi:hypothetical protein